MLLFISPEVSLLFYCEMLHAFILKQFQKEMQTSCYDGNFATEKYHDLRCLRCLMALYDVVRCYVRTAQINHQNIS